MLPERIPQLDVSIGDQANAGQLLNASTCEFRYLDASAHQPSVALLMPASAKLTWTDGDLFPPMDQNLLACNRGSWCPKRGSRCRSRR